MKVIYKKLPSKRKECVTTIGVFDGIHLGHRFILDKVRACAKRRNIPSVIITFDELPHKFLLKKKLHDDHKPQKMPCGYITDFFQKKKIIKGLAMDYCWFLKTNEVLLKLSPRDFLKYVCKYFSIKKLIVGDDFRFGYRAKGGISLLKKLAPEFGFDVMVVSKKTKSKVTISSSHIRELIKKSELREVKRFLGRQFVLRGKVVKGMGVGGKLGFPTANIFPRESVSPASGVYFGYVKLEKKIYLAAINISLRSLKAEGAKEKLVEAHIIKYNKKLLGKKIEIVFIKKIRNERNFSSFNNLRQAIAKDILHISSKYSTYLAKHPQVVVL